MGNEWDITKEVGKGSAPDRIVSPMDQAEMVLIPEGVFTMGISEEMFTHICLLDERINPIFASEIPDRAVHLDAFYIDRYPVTNYQYMKFVKETDHRRPLLYNEPMWNQPFQPVVFVGWEDARQYAKWAGKSLPTEFQWEKAGRGTDGRLWSWGDNFETDRCNSREYGLECTLEIGLFDNGVSPYGCYDMCGNVWEMCEGAWLEDKPVMRGGCFLGSATFVRITCRWAAEDPHNGAHWLGFRCVKEIPKIQ